ncbi:uroporphyrinogen-III synthase [Rhodoligotrophos appendicifer]|uniref:uroporphyrinogen-III synthase n=1 Tax=Rhodoligotrophos appendicifer TaxID=987056 RepID=UPI0014782800
MITRPLEDAAPLQSQLEQLGHEVLTEPLLSIRPLPHATLPAAAYQAIIVTSAHGARAVGSHAKLHGTQLIAVGEKTAEAAREAGFREVITAGGDGEALQALIVETLNPKAGPLLYATGRDVAKDLSQTLPPYGFEVIRVIVYEAKAAKSLSAGLIAALDQRKVDGVLLFSPRTATTWRKAVHHDGREERLADLTHFCLSAAVASALKEDEIISLRITVAAAPTFDSMIELVGTA